MVLVGGLTTLGDLTWVVGEALAGGADVIQYRDKGLPDRELLKRAREVRILTAQARVPLDSQRSGGPGPAGELRRRSRRPGRSFGPRREANHGRDGAHRRIDARPRAARRRDPGGGQLSGRRPGLFQSHQGIRRARARRLDIRRPRQRNDGAYRGSRSAESTNKTSIACSKREPRGSPSVRPSCVPPVRAAPHSGSRLA